MPSRPTEQDGNRELLETVLHAFPDGVLLLTPSGVLLRANDAAAQFLGFPSEGAVGQRLRDVTSSIQIDDRFIADVIARRATVSRAENLADGRKLLVSARPVFASADEPPCVLVVLRDVTGMNQLLGRLQETMPASRPRWVDGRRTKAGDADGATLVAESSLMRAIRERAVQCAATDSPVLILGETGTGKNLLARLIHQSSDRRSGPLREINCGALPAGLIEAELFGYARGAFTGADARGKQGLVELAHGGTLLLDEIGDLPLPLQVKLLRFLEDGEVWPIGVTRPRHPDVRVIAATNGRLGEMMDSGTFRRDLFYRLNVLVITVPPLREHPEDIRPLAEMMLDNLGRRLGRRRRLTAEALAALERYAFPGNVRELWNVMERVVVTTTGESVNLEDLPSEVLCPPAPVALPAAGRHGAPEDVANLKEALQRIEAGIVRQALFRYGTQSRAAKMLGVGQATIARKAKQYGLGQ